MCASSHEMTPSQYVDFTVLTTRGNTGIALPDVANSVFPLQQADTCVMHCQTQQQVPAVSSCLCRHRHQ